MKMTTVNKNGFILFAKHILHAVSLSVITHAGSNGIFIQEASELHHLSFLNIMREPGISGPSLDLGRLQWW